MIVMYFSKDLLPKYIREIFNIIYMLAKILKIFYISSYRVLINDTMVLYNINSRIMFCTSEQFNSKIVRPVSVIINA